MKSFLTLEDIDQIIGQPWQKTESLIASELVRVYAAAVGDGNPRWHSSDADVPLTMLAMVGFDSVVLAMRGINDVVLLGSSEVEGYLPVRVGDKIITTTAITSLRRRQSPAGITAFIAIRQDYTNQRDEKVASCTQTVIVRPGGLLAKYQGFWGSWDGIEIPPLVKQPTIKQLVEWAGVSGDNNPIHFDKEYSVSHGLPGVIVPGQLVLAFLGQMIADWLGAGGALVKLSVSFKGLNFPGSTITCRGVVAETIKGRAVLKVWAENCSGEKTVVGTAVAKMSDQALPQNGAVATI